MYAWGYCGALSDGCPEKKDLHVAGHFDIRLFISEWSSCKTFYFRGKGRDWKEEDFTETIKQIMSEIVFIFTHYWWSA